MKVLSAQQIQQWDAFTIENEPIASIDLMERAAQRCVDWIALNRFIDHPIKIFCGKGNNGGDGLAIARLLMEQSDVMPLVYILEFGAMGTDDFQENLHRLHQVTTNICFIQSAEFFPLINENDVVIDALYGSGLNRPLQSLSAELVEYINKSSATIISIDVPSGMSIDNCSKGNTVIKANHTLTFQLLKLCFLVAENAPYFGKISVHNIGLHPFFPDTIDTVFNLLTKEQVASYIKPANAFAHKGNNGHALLVAGSEGKMGAAILAARACLRTGVGLLTVNVAANQLPIIQIAVPEAMGMIREDAPSLPLNDYAALGLGSGMGTDEDAKELLMGMLRNYHHPVVLDADALSIIALKKDRLKVIPHDSILTPHPKEFDRLFGACNTDYERVYKAIALSEKHPFIIVLKGHYTLIAYKGKGFFNTTGNEGLATGGSGDVLAGMITSLLAQKYEPLHAAIIGVYLHGLAADLALETQSVESLLPSDVIENIGNAYLFLKED